MFVHVYIVLCFSNSVFSQEMDQNLKLELVQVLFRHGARTPTSDEAVLFNHYSESLYDPWGLAQLTREGMIQEYEIGRMLRERYNDFLPNEYQPRHVYAYASGTARTKASLQLVLAALYPPSKELEWNSNVNWMPIPIHSTPRDLDILIKPHTCPKYVLEFEKHCESKEVKNALLSQDQLLERLKEIFGKPVDLKLAFQLYSSIEVHQSLNIQLPSWYSDELFENLKKASELLLGFMSSTSTLKRLHGGPLVRRFLDNINNLNRQKYKRKIYLYCVHESNVHAYIRAHNITQQKIPDYGASIILETYSDSNHKLHIKLLYRDGEPKQLKTLKLENCSEICPLDVYSEIVKQVLPSDDEMLCLLKNAKPKDLEKYFYETDNLET